jgi:hypothetical protein
MQSGLNVAALAHTGSLGINGSPTFVVKCGMLACRYDGSTIYGVHLAWPLVDGALLVVQWAYNV